MQSHPRLPVRILWYWTATGWPASSRSLPTGTSTPRPRLTSYRVRNGVLHNPASDRRTTEGVFHVAEDGLPVPPDKKAVPRLTFARILAAALAPPAGPRAALHGGRGAQGADLPLPPPPAAGLAGRARLVRGAGDGAALLRPGSLAASLDFIESISATRAIPTSPRTTPPSTPALDRHYGCIILATHLTSLTKKELGLPRGNRRPNARGRRHGLEGPSEPYNDGRPFKVCARDERGVIVSIIAAIRGGALRALVRLVLLP